MHNEHRKADERYGPAVQADRAAAECHGKGADVAERPRSDRTIGMHALLVLLLIANLVVLAEPAKAQPLPDSGTAASIVTGQTAAQPGQVYTRPTQKIKLRNYLFDAFGPYPIIGAAFAAGISQAHDAPPEWKQGASGYFRRYESIFAIAAVSTTTRYALAQALKEDTLYYRCDCKGVFPRLRHAVISTFTARRGDDGHLVFSVPGLVAPYAGSMTAIYGWYPGRYDAKDAFRIGNLNLLAHVGGNIALEFIYSGPRSFLSRMHLNNEHGVPNPGSNP